jgi:benzaldehyde dehydrogenase (NAD)
MQLGLDVLPDGPAPPGTGSTANLDAFTETRWVTMRGDIAPYPF